MRTGVFPGSFNPPTVGHLAVAAAARHQCRLDEVHLALSRSTLGKRDDDLVDLDARLAVLEAVAAGRPWLRAVVTTHSLLVDVARGYDVLVLGADKWDQVTDARWYGSEAARDEALARLPALAYAPRGEATAPRVPLPATATVLDVADRHRHVSASGVRTGTAPHWMLPEARAFDDRTGTWRRGPQDVQADDGMA